MSSERDSLESYVDTWETAVGDVVALLRSLGPEDWERPTDLPGWTVRDVAAHLAHLESEMAGNPQEGTAPPDLAHASAVSPAYTEVGTVARRDWSTDAVVDELESAAAARIAEVRADPPTDPASRPARTPGNIDWDWATLVSNRTVDLWMHEQDIRRAVGHPGGLDGPAASHTTRVFARALGYVVGKRVAPPAGTSVLLDISGQGRLRLAVEVGDDGRAVVLPEAPTRPTVALRMDVGTYAVLCGGRRRAADVEVTVEGDEALGERVLASLPVTP